MLMSGLGSVKSPGLRNLNLIDVDRQAILRVVPGAEVGHGAAHRSLGSDQVNQLVVELPFRRDLAKHELLLKNNIG